MPPRRIRFSVAELVEMRRALNLIQMEDAHCNVNMDAKSVKAKESAYRKLCELVRFRLGMSDEEVHGVKWRL